MQTKMLNPQVFLESICYSVFGILLFYLACSGKYLSYVTPRMQPYLYFTAIIMLIWAYVGLRRVFQPQYKIRSAHCFVLVIPILFFLLPHSPLSTTALSSGYNGGSSLIQQNTAKSGNQKVSNSTNSSADSQEDYRNSDAANNTPPDTPSTTTGENGVDELPGLDTANKKITVWNEEFYQWLTEICANTDKYEGYTIVITGSVFKDPQSFTSNEFVPARLLMTCCTADLTPIGFLCKYDKASELDVDTWVTVEGVIHKGKYEGEDQPQIMVTKVTPAEEVEGYIYPYY